MIEAAKSQLVPEPKIASDTFGGGNAMAAAAGGVGVTARLGVDGVEKGQQHGSTTVAATNEEDLIRVGAWV